MTFRRLPLPLLLFIAWQAQAALIPVETSAYKPECGVQAQVAGNVLVVAWNKGNCVLDFSLEDGEPLIRSLAAGKEPLLHSLDPLLSLTVGSRESPSGRPPGMSVWNVFFDNPPKRPYETHLAQFSKKSATVTSQGNRATVRIGEVTCGSFRGDWSFTFYADAPLVQMEAVVSTDVDLRAYVFDLGLVGENAGWKRLAWTDTEERRRSVEVSESAPDEHLMVRHRMLAADGANGSLAIFPPPHAFFYPLDPTANLKNLWHGSGHQGEKRHGIGVRHEPKGSGNFVPWFNAPPGTKQRIGMFLLPHSGNADAALDEALRYTRKDRFADITGMTTYTSHFHMAMTMTVMDQIKKGVNPLPMPEWVKVFKDMNVQALHQGEFHGDGHPQDPGPLRLPEMKMMFSECARLSDDKFLVIPGEEANQHLGIPFPGRHPGHWMLLFPKPVYWTMVRGKDEPFVEQHPEYGTVYHVGDRDEMVDLIKRENGLAWTAHARIKASNWTPDAFKDADFFKDGLWLGAAWKNMPSDLSRDRLGERCLNLLDDMCNWGVRKYLPGEVDVFKIDHTHEVYGHMNINYLRLPKMPRYEEGWKPVLDCLRTGAFFTTTGEILIKEFTVGGKKSGEVATLASPDEKLPLNITLAWTFPLKFAEVISGDGQKVYRVRLDLTNTKPFGEETRKMALGLKGMKWVRLEVWDIARNGAYSQPVWLQ
ncbi:hypothetical protein AYO49_00730 [Verrucomicrobiaceae bacterium SCGC AG-212-N21]|nr:hypothetical protein AYO49_00730 [Verrucomicrobiaceae bacterium SCGC AG-212-N21]